MRLKVLALFSMITILCGISPGQSAQVTNVALLRTFMIATNFGRGTTFSIDVDNREYWITAKHMFTGVKSGPAGTFSKMVVHANILSQIGKGSEGHDLHWITETFKVIDPGKNIDILVLVPDHPLLDYPRGFTLKSRSDGIGLGGNCEFLGFPYGGGWKAKWPDPKHPNKWNWMWLPYIKHCTVSGQLIQDGLSGWVLDGINNHGFSGGPVVYGTGPNQRVFAVISGFHQEPLQVFPAPNSGEMPTSSIPPAPKLPGDKPRVPRKEIVESNSGFIIAFDIRPAIEAIKKDPIGPLLPASSPEK